MLLEDAHNALTVRPVNDRNAFYLPIRFLQDIRYRYDYKTFPFLFLLYTLRICTCMHGTYMFLHETKLMI